MAVAQLSGQSVLRGSKSVSNVHGEHASPAQPERLRVLRDAARRVAEKIRSNARRTETTRAKRNSAAALRGRRSDQGNERFHREACRGKYFGDVIQRTRRQDRQVE